MRWTVFIVVGVLVVITFWSEIEKFFSKKDAAYYAARARRAKRRYARNRKLNALIKTIDDVRETKKSSAEDPGQEPTLRITA